MHRSTHPVETPKEYFRRAIVIPFFDDVNNQLHERFPHSSVTVVSALMGLIPAVLIKSTMDDIPKIVDNLAISEGDLVRFDSLTTARDAGVAWQVAWL